MRALALVVLLGCTRSSPPVATTDGPSDSTPPTSVASAAASIYVGFSGAPTAPWGRGEFFDPEASRPKTHYALVALDAKGELGDGPVRQLLANHENVWRYCFWGALAAHPTLGRGAFVAKFTLREGKLEGVEVTPNPPADGRGLGDADVAQCVRDALPNLSASGAAKGRTEVVWTFELGPG